MGRALSCVMVFASLLFALAIAGCEKSATESDPEVLAAALRAGVILEREPASYQHPLGINFDNKIMLLGMDVSPAPLKPGLPYTLTLYLKVLAPIPHDYAFFGHFESHGKTRARVKMDHPVTGGSYPTSQWRPGQILRDTFRSRMPAEFPSEKGVLWGGFFKGKTRLPVVGADPSLLDAESRVKLATLPVTKTLLSPRELTIYRTIDPIVLDGKLNEKSWKRASSTGYFKKSGGDGPVVPHTLARFLWDDTNLYIAFVADDEDVWTSFTGRDDPLYKEECVEIMIDADGSGKTYFEFQVNAANAGYDASFESRRAGRKLDWDSGMTHAVHVEGTLNKRDDTDTRWTVEIAIPLASITDAPNTPPKTGDRWRLNVYRLEKPSAAETRGSMWSPTLVGDFHALARFGTVIFSDLPVDKKPKPVKAVLGRPEGSNEPPRPGLFADPAN